VYKEDELRNSNLNGLTEIKQTSLGVLLALFSVWL
jgi:hypothetical protein